MTPDMEKEMTTMCNLSLNISEEAMKEGRVLGREEGRVLGREEGLKEGENRALSRTAIRLLTMGLSVDDVAKGTGLSVEAVEKMKENME